MIKFIGYAVFDFTLKLFIEKMKLRVCIYIE